jgi:hypothetical protein
VAASRTTWSFLGLAAQWGILLVRDLDQAVSVVNDYESGPVRFPMNGALPQGPVFARIGAAPPGVQKGSDDATAMFAQRTFRF